MYLLDVSIRYLKYFCVLFVLFVLFVYAVSFIAMLHLHLWWFYYYVFIIMCVLSSLLSLNINQLCVCVPVWGQVSMTNTLTRLSSTPEKFKHLTIFNLSNFPPALHKLFQNSTGSKTVICFCCKKFIQRHQEYWESGVAWAHWVASAGWRERGLGRTRW